VTPRDVVLLGSTGSIGTQALDIVRRNPDRFRVVALGSGGGNVELLAAQAIEFKVDAVGLARASTAQDLQLALYAEAQKQGYAQGHHHVPKMLTGPDAMAELAGWPADVVLNAVVGSIGLAPTLAALRAGRTLALANKESLIAGAPLVKAALQRMDQLVPVDSEHSALAQCLRAGTATEVRKLILTASGGPFRGRSRDELANVTVEQALAHPTWNMGHVITINSATLVNKGLEVIEAHELFGVGYDDIEVVVHPQSVIHSMVEFTDGSTIAQLSMPDMRLPIGYALAYPDRISTPFGRIDWQALRRLDFEPVDTATFRCLPLAYEAGRTGSTAPAWLSAANEVAVDAFLSGRIRWSRIAEVCDATLQRFERSSDRTVDDIIAADARARQVATEVLAA